MLALERQSTIVDVGVNRIVATGVLDNFGVTNEGDGLIVKVVSGSIIISLASKLFSIGKKVVINKTIVARHMQKINPIIPHIETYIILFECCIVVGVKFISSIYIKILSKSNSMDIKEVGESGGAWSPTTAQVNSFPLYGRHLLTLRSRPSVLALGIFVKI